MNQTTKLTLSQKIQLVPKLSESLKILSVPNNQLREYLNDYSMNNPLVDIVTPPRFRTPLSIINNTKAVSTSSLDMHLFNQLNYSAFSAKHKKAMYDIISCLDKNGFFKGDIAAIAENTGFSTVQIEQMLNEIKTLDPPGIGSKDYKESIMTQLKAKGLLSSSGKKVIEYHLNDLSRGDFTAIEAATGIRVSASKKLLIEIQKLNPYPAKSFCSSEPTVYIEPDIIISNSKNGLKVSLNKSIHYRIIINDNKDLRLNQSLSPNDLDYINAMYKEAAWLKKSLHKRYETLLRCGEKIAQSQKTFFCVGSQNIMPLRKKDIAGMLNMHPSTISRALNNKYIECDQGVYSTEFFFSGRSCFSGKYSPIQLKTFIKKIINEENKLFPESDIKIAIQLKALGIEISRRTVAKYRADLGISPANIRKRI